jgi:hypothetical protein
MNWEEFENYVSGIEHGKHYKDEIEIRSRIFFSTLGSIQTGMSCFKLLRQGAQFFMPRTCSEIWWKFIKGDYPLASKACCQPSRAGSPD